MKNSIFLVFIFLSFSAAATTPDSSFSGGKVGIGLRGAFNFFPAKNDFWGWGSGGHFKLSASKKVNTEWFIDHIQSIDNRSGSRKDYHIGWAVQFSPGKSGFGSSKPIPYFMGGQCFDLTRVTIQPILLKGGSSDPIESPLVFSAAAQLGGGLSWFVHPGLELNLQIQYMLHFGKDVHIDYSPLASDGLPAIDVEKDLVADAHILTTFSCTYYLFRLWKK